MVNVHYTGKDRLIIKTNCKISTTKMILGFFFQEPTQQHMLCLFQTKAWSSLISHVMVLFQTRAWSSNITCHGIVSNKGMEFYNITCHGIVSNKGMEFSNI